MAFHSIFSSARMTDKLLGRLPLCVLTIYIQRNSPVDPFQRKLIIESTPKSINPQRKPIEASLPGPEAQSKPTDAELFPTPDNSELQRLLPKAAARPADVGTVRIYARSLRLTKSPLAQESVHPSVITVERAALCQIFLETKYHKAFQQPSERDLRRQTLETLVSNGKELTTEQKFKFNEILKSVESEWSRLSRVRPSIDAFTIERKLGSGGFGVVNMVTEKKTGQVYAMKV
jgi:hypothetical protein